MCSVVNVNIFLQTDFHVVLRRKSPKSASVQPDKVDKLKKVSSSSAIADSSKALPTTLSDQTSKVCVPTHSLAVLVSAVVCDLLICVIISWYLHITVCMYECISSKEL